MASWLDRGRPVILEALRQAGDKIAADLDAALHARDAEQHAFLTKEVERLKARVAAVEKLEQENRTLKEEVSTLRTQLKSASSTAEKARLSVPAPLATRQPLGEISVNTPSRLSTLNANPKDASVPTVPAAKYEKLQQDYDRVVNTCERMRKVKDAHYAAAHKHREEKERWIKYATSLEAKLEKRKKDGGERTTQSRSSTEPTRPHPASQALTVQAEPTGTSRATTPKTSLDSSVRPQPSATASFSDFDKAGLPELSPRRATSSPPDSRHAEPGEPGSDSTEGDEDDAGEQSLPRLPPNDNNAIVVIKNEPSSDLPVVVSERRVGKRKRDDDMVDAMTPRRVKVEEGSSDPLVTGERPHFLPQESLDLDTDGTITTPRKIRMLQMLERPAPDMSENRIPRWVSDRFHVRNPLSKANTRQDDTEQPPLVPVPDMRVYAAPAIAPLSESSVRPKRVRDSGLRLDHGIASLAEDGSDPTDTDSERHAATENHSAEAPSRLSTLLNASSPLPQGQTPLLRPSRPSRDASLSSPWLTDTPVRILPFGKDGKDRAATATSKSRPGGDNISTQASTGTVSRVQPPKAAAPLASKPKAASKRLREQPLSSLRLDSFKVNPKFNNGQNFAFTEVVRNKDERATIPGCVDPSCCGKHFRAMAQSELEAVGPSLIHRQADIALLEDYLGEQVYKLGSMTRQEKEDLWLEAKTRDLANKHGKHRHRYTRQQSPPGFWNTEFPTTQDNERDREEGEKRERREVEQRYREALREGGRFLFRDE